MPEVIVKKSAADEIEFFGDIDRKDGKISGPMPAWYFRRQQEQIENDISLRKSTIERQHLTGEDRAKAVSDIKQLEDRLNSMRDSKPKLDGQKKDLVNKVAVELGKSISDSMFTRTEMMRGTADAYEEMTRNEEPCIVLSDEQIALARKANCRINSKGQVSRNDATRVWKMCQRLRGENTDQEILRRG